MDTALLRNLSHALRWWNRRRALACTVVLILAAGIGSTTALFSVVDGLLLRPLSWPAADRLVVIHAVLPHQRHQPAYAATWNRSPLSWSAWTALREARAFEDIGAWYASDWFVRGTHGEVAHVLQASASLLPLLGVSPREGRTFSADEDLADSGSLILTHGAWLRWFGGRANVVGESITVSASPVSPLSLRTVVGILPPDVQFPMAAPDFILPLGGLAWSGRFDENRFLRAIGRLPPNVSAEAASVMVEPLVRGLDPPERRSARLVAVRDELTGGVAPLFSLAFAGAAVLLAVACSTVAGLLLNEGRARRHELGVRMSLGATRADLLRQLTAEHAILGTAAALGGLATAAWLTPVLVALAPGQLANAGSIGMDARVAWFALTVSGVTTMVFGLVPASALLNAQARDVLSRGGSQHSRQGRSWHGGVVAFALALAIVLLASAALLGESMMRLRSTARGFDVSNVLVADVRLTRMPPLPARAPMVTTVPDMATLERARAETSNRMLSGWIHTAGLLERLAGLPGVTGVAGTSALPLGGSWTPARIRLADAPAEEERAVRWQMVTEGYFDILRIALVEGRTFTRDDRIGARVAVASRELARRFLGGRPVNRRVVRGQVEYTVIGVVGDVVDDPTIGDEAATLYVLDQTADSVRHVLIRSTQLSALSSAVRPTIERYDPFLSVTSTAPMASLLARSVAEERFRAIAAAGFAISALVLSLLGIYGVASRAVVERHHEIGIRMALGAQSGDVARLIAREIGIVVLAGIVTGTVAARVVSHVIRAYLFGVSAGAPYVFIGSIAILAVVAFIATLGPILRAAKIDPMLVLRE